MKSRKFILIALLMLVFIISTACSPTSETTETTEMTNEQTAVLESKIEAQAEEITSLENELTESAEKLSEIVAKLEELENQPPQPLSSTNLLSASLDVLEALDTKDMALLESLSHPTTPIRFTPYAYVNASTDLTFSANAFPTLINDTTVFTWGEYDGSGDPLNLTFDGYLDAFVYDEDYLNPHMIGLNNTIGQGNSLNNVASSYPSASFVEFHFTGFDPQYGGMDWSSLILVFEQVSGNWKLIAIVHNQWTI